MADFCRQCSVVLGAPEGWSDFKDDSLAPGETRVNLCEGCGMAETTASGECVSLIRMAIGDRAIAAWDVLNEHENHHFGTESSAWMYGYEAASLAYIPLVEAAEEIIAAYDDGGSLVELKDVIHDLRAALVQVPGQQQAERTR